MADKRGGSGPQRPDRGAGAGRSGGGGRAGGAGRSSDSGSGSGGRSGGAPRGGSADRRGSDSRAEPGRGERRPFRESGRPTGPRDDKRADGRGDRRTDRGDRPGFKREDRRDDRSGDRRGRSDRTPAERSAEQARYDGPEIPEDVTGKELDRSIANQLKGLPEKLAARVARHLAAAGLIIDEDPRTAYEHTLAARARASRIAVVREACGEAAYAAGEYAEALSELRAAKRMNGATEYLPIMADCERALGRPEKALALARNPSVARFEAHLMAEMTIVEAGARRDMKELDAALRTLEAAPLNSKSREEWVVRLRYAYADTLLAAGRPADALEWFHRTEAIDGTEITDAAARAAEVEKSLDGA